MAQTPSHMVELGTPAADFRLPDAISGMEIPLAELRGEKATVVMFICNHCPFVKHINKELVKIGNDYHHKGVSFVAISSNDAENYPEDSPEKMKDAARDLEYPFPYLYDESQEVARAYHATCTPDFFIYDAELLLRYRGQLDSSRPGNDVPVSGTDLRQALDALVRGELPSTEQKPSIGCNIKWKA